MNTKTRKQRDFEKREKLFIEIAREILLKNGIDTLTMEQVADKAEYSKGTLYKHFSCKEDLVAAICNNALSNLAKLMQIAQSYPGLSRDKIVATLAAYGIYAEKFPEEFEIIFASRSTDLLAKASEERQEIYNQIESQILGALQSTTSLGIEEGNLELPDGLTIDQICFGTWALSFGTYTLSEAEGLETSLQLPATEEMLFRLSMLLFDGYQWRPFSYEKDYISLAAEAAEYVAKNYQDYLAQLD